jgi:hypothetical protein
MIRILIWIIVLYGLYRLIFNFIIPVLRVSHRMRQQVKDYNNHMQNQQQQQTQYSSETEKKSGAKTGDYIDFEEVK